MQTQNTPFPLQQIIDEFGFEGEYIGYRVSNDGHINNTFVLDFKNADGSSTSYLVQLINTNVFKNPDELMENIVGVTGYLRNIVIERGGDPERECLRVFFTKGGKPISEQRTANAGDATISSPARTPASPLTTRKHSLTPQRLSALSSACSRTIRAARSTRPYRTSTTPAPALPTSRRQSAMISRVARRACRKRSTLFSRARATRAFS